MGGRYDEIPTAEDIRDVVRDDPSYYNIGNLKDLKQKLLHYWDEIPDSVWTSFVGDRSDPTSIAGYNRKLDELQAQGWGPADQYEDGRGRYAWKKTVDGQQYFIYPETHGSGRGGGGLGEFHDWSLEGPGVGYGESMDDLPSFSPSDDPMEILREMSKSIPGLLDDPRAAGVDENSEKSPDDTTDTNSSGDDTDENVDVNGDSLHVGDQITGEDADGNEVSGEIESFSFGKPVIDGHQVNSPKKQSFFAGRVLPRTSSFSRTW